MCRACRRSRRPFKSRHFLAGVTLALKDADRIQEVTGVPAEERSAVTTSQTPGADECLVSETRQSGDLAH